MKKLVFIMFLIVLLIILVKKEEIIIPNESIRIRIIANSDEEIDQFLKSKVKDSINKDVNELLKNVTTIDDARTLLTDNVEKINYKVNTVLKNNNSELSSSIDFGYNYFPAKEYKGYLYKEGTYESLVIKLGDAKGKNFWCVMFPPLCLDEQEEKEFNEVQYKSFIKEILNKYL